MKKIRPAEYRKLIIEQFRANYTKGATVYPIYNQIATNTGYHPKTIEVMVREAKHEIDGVFKTVNYE